MTTMACPSDDRPTTRDTRFECRICWHVYDPAEGDPVWQIPPGTAFADLPEHWSCPRCASTKDGFLVLNDD